MLCNLRSLHRCHAKPFCRHFKYGDLHYLHLRLFKAMVKRRALLSVAI
jgi:hypothetical protein